MGRDWPEGGREPRRSPMDTGNEKLCDCPMMSAVRSLKRGKFRLARRYALMSIRILAN